VRFSLVIFVVCIKTSLKIVLINSLGGATIPYAADTAF